MKKITCGYNNYGENKFLLHKATVCQKTEVVLMLNQTNIT